MVLTVIYFLYWHDLRKEPIVQQRRQNGGGSVMIWAGISGDRKTNLCCVEGNMNSVDYQRVLRNHFLPSKNNNDLLMQDNASIHVSHSTKNWLANKLAQISDSQQFDISCVPQLTSASTTK